MRDAGAIDDEPAGDDSPADDASDAAPEAEQPAAGHSVEAAEHGDDGPSSASQHDLGSDDADDAHDEEDEEEDEQGRQRRQNVRINVKYPISVVVDGHPNTRGRSRDLSATGVGFATRLPLDVDTTGSVTIDFPDWQFTKTFIVRFVKPILAGRIVGVQFDELSADERERVVKEVFAVQREQLQAQRARQAKMAGS